MEENKRNSMLALKIPSELHYRFKVAAAQEGKTLTQIVVALLEQYIEGPPLSATPTKKNRIAQPGVLKEGCWDHRGTPKSWCPACQKEE